MSKHSKNSNSSLLYTPGQRKLLKNVYGTIETRIGQDSIQTFEMCTICNQQLIEPTSCDQGHLFCRTCIIEYMVKQKKMLAEQKLQADKEESAKEKIEKEKQLAEQVQKIQAFEKYDGFLQVQNRSQLFTPKVTPEDFRIKPVGIYELNPSKAAFVKTSFWSVENTPQFIEPVKKCENTVFCPAKKHKLTMKKLRAISCKVIDNEYMCWICSKEIKRQTIGAYKCGHVVCLQCRSDKCEICAEKNGWMDIENSSSSFAAHNKANVTTYTHAFLL